MLYYNLIFNIPISAWLLWGVALFISIKVVIKIAKNPAPLYGDLHEIVRAPYAFNNYRGVEGASDDYLPEDVERTIPQKSIQRTQSKDRGEKILGPQTLCDYLNERKEKIDSSPDKLAELKKEVAKFHEVNKIPPYTQTGIDSIRINLNGKPYTLVQYWAVENKKG